MDREVLYNLAEYSTNEAAYEGMTEKIAAIAENLDREYFVAWESENHLHDSTVYNIIDTDEVVGEQTLIIEGGRGGTYEIVPKMSTPPYIRYLNPSGNIGWSEEAKLIMIAGTDAIYEKRDAEAVFIEFFNDVRDQLPFS